MLSHWKPLNLTIPDTHLPSLLVKYDFGPSYYNIFLTDLTSIWVESLERRQIVKRALNSDTSIDPSENNEQLQLLLLNIQKALDGEDASRISINKGENINQLDLSTVTPLPASLKSLRWSFYLDSAPRNLLTVELLVPCLSKLSSAKAQIASLLQQLKEKDHVITKLADKMRANGTDFSQVFPGAAGIKYGTQKNIRETVGKSVKGLEVFDEEQWRNELSKVAADLSPKISDVLSHVFLPDPGEIPPINIQINSGTWWQYLERKEHQEIKAATPNLSMLPQPSNSSLESDSNDTNDGKFQRQISPAHLRFLAREENEKSSTKDMKDPQQATQSLSPEHDDSTTDDSDGEVSSTKLQDPQRNLSSRLSVALKRDLKVLSKGNPDFNTVHKTTGTLDISKDVAPSTPTNDADQQNDALNEVISPKLKPRLGRIGGRTQINTDNEVNSMQDQKSERHQLTSKASNSPCTGRTPIQPNSPSIPQETSQEKANNKRENLKRELESKSNARLKKKRKF